MAPASRADVLIRRGRDDAACAGIIRNQIERGLTNEALRELVLPKLRRLEHDPGAAEDLLFAAPNRLRGLIVLILFFTHGFPREVFRRVLLDCWTHDHAHLIAAAGTRRDLRRLFEDARYPIPAELGETVTIWRGTCDLPLHKARLGYSWTTSRDVACWFAMRRAIGNTVKSPLVLRATLPRERIALFTHDRGEAEVVVVRRIERVTVDGTFDDWQERYECQEAANQRWNHAVFTGGCLA